MATKTKHNPYSHFASVHLRSVHFVSGRGCLKRKEAISLIIGKYIPTILTTFGIREVLVKGEAINVKIEEV